MTLYKYISTQSYCMLYIDLYDSTQNNFEEIWDF